MRKLRSIALAALVAAVAACTSTGGAPCNVEFGPYGDDVVSGSIYEMPDLDMVVGDTVKTPLRDYYGPEGCMREEVFSLSSSNPGSVAVWVSDSRLVTVAIGIADTVRVTVGLDNDYFGFDDDNLYPPHEFLVTVRPGS